MTYQYFLLGDSVPVRVTFNDKGLKMGAEVPSREKGGLVYNHSYLDRVFNNDMRNFDEVEEITEEQFRQKAEAMLEQSIG